MKQISETASFKNLNMILKFELYQGKCAVPGNIHTPPTEGIGISWGEGGSLRLNNLKKCTELNWNFQRGGEVLGKIPSVGEVWIFLGTTQWSSHVNGKNFCKGLNVKQNAT